MTIVKEMIDDTGSLKRNI